MPLLKGIFEDFKFRIRYLYLFFRNGFKIKTIVFYPEYPSKRSITYKIARFLGYNITNNTKLKAQCAIYWHNVTLRNHSDVAELKKTELQIINENCLDISKKHVDKIFGEIFGYNMTVNPTEHAGKAVKKSDENAKHDGVIIQCPIKKGEVDNAYIYMRLINNQFNDSLVEDIRVPVFNRKTPFAYLKYRSIDDRFSNGNSMAKIIELQEVISQEEIEKTLQFCKAIGLDYGELDILRNRDDNKLYIVDVNYTPWGPPNHLLKAHKKIAVQKLSKFFKKEFLA